ncbi:hypothetical protein DL93DRAFT_2080311 [Clavulina sp. PMI_390]|nr:hypothetical protein DL93DRAFT_2080311 [Clavulina sp. PMI_390]
MMDRHFIYPPGYHQNTKKRKRDDGSGPDGDASSSVLIQQLKIKLDTPEDIAKWIEDRKKRWPTAKRVEEKKQAEEDAKARGELFPERSRFSRQKPATLQNQNQSLSSYTDRGRGRGRGQPSRGRARGRGRGIPRGGTPSVGGTWRSGPRDPTQRHGLPPKPMIPEVEEGEVEESNSSDSDSSDLSTSSSDSDDSSHGTDDDQKAPPSVTPQSFPTATMDVGDDDSDSDMDPVRDAISSKVPPTYYHHISSSETSPVADSSNRSATKTDPSASTQGSSSQTQSEPSSSTTPSQNQPGAPPNPPRRRREGPKSRSNPFSQSVRSRPTLLRNLLQREVDVTLSNLSQAIRFIVANDCLKDVELRPGQAEEEKNEREKVVVLGESSSEGRDQKNTSVMDIEPSVDS